jgi:hypothetical protein
MTSPDQRMLWIRSMEALSSSSNTNVVEAELGSEARITGQLDHGNGAVLLRPITYQRDGKGLLKYVLRMRHPIGLDPERELPTSRHGYFFRGGPVGELIALTSLVLRARIFLLSITSRGDHHIPSSKVEFPGPVERVDPRVDNVVFDESPRNFTEDVGPFLEKVKSIPAKFHLELAIAAGRYSNALLRVGEDEELVLVTLVSAVERLALKQTIIGDPIAGLKHDQILRTESLPPEVVEELAKVIQVRKSRQRFVSFVQDYSKGFFDSEPREPPHTQVTSENLREIMEAVYNARSAYLHNGDPMYLSSGRQAFPHWHMDPTVGKYEQDRYFAQKQKLPFADFFHRLVRHCILARMERILQEAAEQGIAPDDRSPSAPARR